MKKTLFNRLLTLGLCVSMLGGVALAAEESEAVTTTEETISATVEEQTAIEQPVITWGKVAIEEDGSLLITNDAQDAIHNELIAKINESTKIVDAETGYAVNAADIAEGSTVYAWLGNQMTMSIPPQANAIVLVANITEENQAPDFFKVAEIKETDATDDTPATKITFTTTDGSEIVLADDIALLPYKTRNIIMLDDIIAGFEILVWSDAEGTIERVVVFPQEVIGEAEDAEEAVLDPSIVYGAIENMEDGSLFVKNDNNEVIIKIAEETAIVDAATGDAVNAADMANGSIIYAYIGETMTMSLPPQATANLILANITDGIVAPKFYQTAAVAKADDTSITVTTVDGAELTVSADAALVPYLTRNIVTLDSIIPGTKMLVWADAEGKTEKVMVFAYGYNGYMETAEDKVSVSGAEIPVKTIKVEDMLYAPLRSVAETAGFEVSWTRETGATISLFGTELVSFLPEMDKVMTEEGETWLRGKCVINNDLTYIPAADLAYFTNLFYAE